MVERAEQYHWSSYLPTLGKAAVPENLTTQWILANFSASLAEARRLYRQFVKEGMTAGETPWQKLSGQIILGTEGFIQHAKEMIGGREEIPEIPRTQRHVGRPAVEDIFPAETKITKQERNHLIRHAYSVYGYTLKEIAQALGVHYTTISKVINRKN